MTMLAVLAGGEGRRMGGPKDLLLADGEPVLHALVKRIGWIGRTVLVAPHGGRLPPGHDAFEAVVSDAASGRGPLQGILAALGASASEEMVVIPVDMPGIERQHLEWLVERLSERKSAPGMMLRRGDRIEPFPSAFRTAAVDMIQRRLEAGEFAVHGLVYEPGVEVVAPPREWGDDVWRNVNELRDLPEGWSRRE